MSTIIFEGNTYTFGATVSANPGTGTVNYSLSGLASGSTYGFIVWAYNGLGPSSIVGPISALTQINLDIRDSIVLYMWDYPGIDQSNLTIVYDYFIENRTNLVSPSQPNLDGSTNYLGPFQSGISIITPGFTAPDGSTSASKFENFSQYKVKSIHSTDSPEARPLSLGTGSTYYFSFWQNTSLGKTSSNFAWLNGYTGEQLFPIRGSSGAFFPGLPIVYPSGNCGWVRFVFQFVRGDTSSPVALGASVLSQSPYPSGNTLYLWGFQLEAGNTFPQSRYDAGISDYRPNILASGSTFYDSPDYSIVNNGIIVWNTSPEWVGNWGACNGITYIFPTVNPTVANNYPDGNISYPDEDRIWTANRILTKGITNLRPFKKNLRYLKQFPENRRSIRPSTIEVGEIITSTYEDWITSPSYPLPTGLTLSFLDENYGSFNTYSLTGYIGNFWPEKGISNANRLFQAFFEAFAATGATIGYLSFDWESSVFPVSVFTRSNANSGLTAARALASDPRYRQNWNGLTAIGDLMDSAGATLFDIRGIWAETPDALYWGRYMAALTSKMYELAWAPVYSYFPNVQMGNYNNFISNENPLYDPNQGSGTVFVGGANVIGQFAAPYLYGEYSSFGLDNRLGAKRINPLDTSKLILDTAKLYGPTIKNRILTSEIVGLDGLLYEGGTGIYPVSGVTSPFGNYAISLFVGNTANISHAVMPSFEYGQKRQTAYPPIPDLTPQPYVFSVYVKSPSSNFNRYIYLNSRIIYGDGFPGPYSENRYAVGFDILNGTTSSVIIQPFGACGFTSPYVSHGIEHAGNSWYRCWISDAGLTYWKYRVWHEVGPLNGPTLTSTIPVQTTSGISGFYIWGAQMETGTLPSEYERTQAGYTYINSLDPAWVSFIMNMQLVRTHRRNSSNIPLIPWIADVNYTGDGTGITATRPVVGYANVNLGYNPRKGNTYTERGGNSAYYYEMVRHIMLHGTKGINLWPGGGLYNDIRYYDPGPVKYLRSYLQNGNCGWFYDLKNLNNTLKEVNELIGGFTMTSGDVSRPSWISPYIASGSPGPNGNTWWWRVTIQPGYTISIDGYTLPDAQGNIGKWVSTTGPTLAYVPITVL